MTATGVRTLANRIGSELTQTFYGSSFCADMRGDKVGELDRTTEGLAMATFDRAKIHAYRASWGFFASAPARGSEATIVIPGRSAPPTTSRTSCAEDSRTRH